MSEGASDFSRLGGREGLEPIIDEFVRRVVEDPMIGYMFRQVRTERLRRFEAQHAEEHLGGPRNYEGRPLAVAHRPHRIMGGQFMRRREILRQVLVEADVPEDIIGRWLADVDSLRPLITADASGECVGAAEPRDAELRDAELRD